MSDITKALNILNQSKEKQLLFIGSVIEKTSDVVTVDVGGTEVEAYDFSSVSAGDTVAMICQNKRFYILGKK